MEAAYEIPNAPSTDNNNIYTKLRRRVKRYTCGQIITCILLVVCGIISLIALIVSFTALRRQSAERNVDRDNRTPQVTTTTGKFA